MTDIKYDSKKHWAINYDIYCGYANLTDAQIEYYTKEIRTLLTDGGNFAHVEIDGDGTLITIWADDNVEDLSNFNQLLTELSSLGAIIEEPEVEEDDTACATFVAYPPTETAQSDNAPRVKTVYRKAVIYVRADIDYTDEADFQNQLEEFENNVCVDLDNINSGNYNYEFTYDGLTAINEEEVPCWLFD